MDEIQKLYDALSKRGYYTKSFDDFKVQFQDKAYQDKVYNVVSRDGLYTKSKDEFLTKYSSLSQEDTSKKKVSSVVSQAGGEVGTSEPPLRKEKVLDYLKSLKSPAVVVSVGKEPIVSREEAILPVQRPKKIDTNFGLTKEKVQVDISPKLEEISIDADPLGLAEKRAAESKDLQKKQDYLTSADLYSQISIPSGYQASIAASSPDIKKETATGQVLLKRANEYNQAVEGLREIDAPDLMVKDDAFIQSEIMPKIERAAVMYKIKSNPSFEKELKAVGVDINSPNLSSALGNAKMGSIMEEFLENPNVASYSNSENPNLAIALQYAKDKNIEINKDWGIATVANKVSREFERSEQRRNPVAPFVTESLKKDLDDVAKETLKPEEYKIYNDYIKGNEEEYLDTPSFLGGFAEHGRSTLEGFANTIGKITGVKEKDIIRERWRKEAMNVSADPEGWRKFFSESGKISGLVATLAGTGGFLRSVGTGAGLTAKTAGNVSDAVNIATAFLGDMIDDAVYKYPGEPVKQGTSATFNTLLFMAMGRDIFPAAKIKSAFTAVKPEVEKVVTNLTNGTITREAARQQMNTITKKAIGIASEGIAQNTKVAAELTGLGILNEGLDVVMDMDEDKMRKYYPEGVHGDTFKSMFLGNAIVSSVAGYGRYRAKNDIAKEAIYEAASNPKRYERIINDLAIKDPNVTKEELLGNLAFAVETKRLLDQRGFGEKQQKDYLLKALGERAAIIEKEKIADSNLRKEAEEKIKQAQAEKDAILAGEEVMPEPKIIDEVLTEMPAPEIAGEEAAPQVPAVQIAENFKKDFNEGKLQKGEYGGGRNLGVYDYEGNIVKVVKEKRRLGENQIILMRERLGDMDNVYIPKQEIDLGERVLGIVMDKATGIDASRLTKEQIDAIPQEHWDKFEADIRELSKRGVAVDLTKRDNFFYDKDRGFSFIDISGISVDGDPTTKFFMKDGVEFYYPFEQYPVFPKKFEGGKKMFENIAEIKKEEAAPQVPAAPEKAPEVAATGFRPVEGFEEFEVVGPKKEAPETKEETDIRKRALNLDVEGNIRGEVLQYFIGNGTVSPDTIKRLFQRKDNNIRWNNMKPEERKTRIGFMKKGSPSIEVLAEKLAGADRLDITQDFRNAIEDVLLGSGGKRDMAKELVESYDAEYKMMMRDRELAELGEEMERQVQEFTAGLPEAQKKEIIEVLDEFRFNDGSIDWARIEKELEAADPFSPEIILRLSPETQKTIQDGIKQIKETGRVSRVPVETAPSPETFRGEAPTAAATPQDKRAEARQQLKDAFNDLMNLGIAYDPRSQAEKQVRLTKAIINVIKQEAIGAIKDLQKYIKDNLGFDISDKDAKYLLIESKKPEYVQEQAAGEVPVRPETRAGKKVEEGVPPAEPPRITEEGETPRQERQKALLNRIVDSSKTPADLKEKIREKGLSYLPATQSEATRLANSILDTVGVDQAVEMASKGEFSGVFGGLNTAVLSQAASRFVNDPVKQAQIFDVLDTSLRSKGQDISYMNEFYAKNPLGVVIYENTRRKNDFDQWSSAKEKKWQEAFDALKAEKEELRKELEELRTEKPTSEGVQRAKGRAEAAKKKRADLIEKYKKGGGLTLTTGGLTKEGIEFVGEVSLTYVQEGIANAEVVIRKVLADLKTIIGKEPSPEVRDEVEQLVRKTVREKKGKPVIDRIRKKLDGLSDKEKEQVIQQSYKKIIESGALEFEDFKNIIADVLGRGPLSEEQSQKLQQLVTTINEVEAKALDAQELRTPEALKAYKLAQKEAAEASKELSTLFNNKPNILKRVSQLIQLRTLGVIALINNPAYNIVNQAFLRFPIGLTNTLIDRAISGAAKVSNVQFNPSTNVLSRRVQAEYFKKLKLGFKESGEQLLTGLNRQDYIQKETYAQSIQPIESMKALYRYAKGEQKMQTAEVIDRALQATGADAEAVARTLNLGDKPFRFGSEGATAADFSEALGLSKGIDYDLFIEFPKAEAYRIYKNQGLTDAEATQKSELIEKSIIQEGKRAAFQQDNILNDKLRELFGEEKSGAGALTKTLIVSPYVKTPTNVFWSYYNLLHPEVALLQAFVYGGKAYKLREKDPIASKLALREGRYWFGHAVTGMAYVSVISSMVAAGIFTAGSTAEDTKKEREGRSYYGKPGTTNVTKLMAWLRGEDPSKIKGGFTIKNSWFGHIGTLGNAIARREQEMTPEQLKKRGDLIEYLVSNITSPRRSASEALESLETGIFSNTSSLFNALSSDFGAKRWALNTINLLTNVVHPATLAQISRAELPYYSTTKANSFMEEIKNSMLQRSSVLRTVLDQQPPAKVGIWGDRLEKKDNFMMRWFGISKNNPDNFAQPLYEIVKRTNNISYFPPTIKPEIEDQGKKSNLNAKQTMELEMMVGQYRKNLVAPLLNDASEIEDEDEVGIGKYGTWSEVEGYFKREGFSDEEARKKADKIKLKALKKTYDLGFELGKQAFLDAHPEFRNLDYDKTEEEMEEKEMEKFGKSLEKRAGGLDLKF